MLSTSRAVPDVELYLVPVRTPDVAVVRLSVSGAAAVPMEQLKPRPTSKAEPSSWTLTLTCSAASPVSGLSEPVAVAVGSTLALMT